MEQNQFILTPKQLKEAVELGVTQSFDKLKKELYLKSPTEHLTIKETCTYLRINRTTLWALTKRGDIRSYCICSKILYKRLDVENIVTELKPSKR